MSDRSGEPVVLRRRFVVAGVGILVVVASWHSWNQRPAVVEGAAVAPVRPALQLTGQATGELLREQAEFFDPTPLFFPTPLNFGQGRAIQALGREPSEGFENFAPDFLFTEKLRVYGQPISPAPQRPEDLLTFADEAPFKGLGRTRMSFPELAERAGFMEVKSISGGAIMLRQALTDVRFPVADFAPVEFLFLVGANGVVGEPFITANSGSDRVDAYVREYLVNSFRIGERLPPGRYAVSVGR